MEIDYNQAKTGEIHKFAPSPTDLGLIGVFTLLTRLICLLVAMRLLHLTAAQFALHTGDGWSYIGYAKFLSGLHQGVEDFDLRLFPGTPMLIAALHAAGIPITAAALGLTIGSSALANIFAAVMLRDRRIGWAMVALTPDWLISGSSVASEAPLLAFTLAGILLATRQQKGWPSALCGGILLGFAGTIRPVACFAVLGYLVFAARFRLWGRGAIVALASLAVVAATLLFLHVRLGDALHGVKIYAHDPNAYGGQLFWFPGRSLFTTPFWYPVPRVKIFLVWGEAAVLLFTCVLAILNCRRRDADGFDFLFAPWLVGNTLFTLCVGSHWGFNIFKRLTLPALPAELGTLRRWIPRWFPLVWPLLAATSVVVAIILLVRH